MDTEYVLSYTGSEIEERLGMVDSMVKSVNGQMPDENGNVNVEGGSGSLVANVTQTDSGAVISITDKNGTTTATVTNGKDGKDGEKGDTGATGAKGEKGDPGADGKDGTNGKDGADGQPGKDGYTPQKGVDYFDGTDGRDGYTPVRGVDYWTTADKAEIEAYLATELAKRGQLAPEYANSIEKCTDTSKLYVLPDGMIYAYILTEVEAGPSYKNWLTYSVNKDGSDYKGDNGEDGYRKGYRYSSSSAAEKAQTGYDCIGWIPVNANDVIRIKNVGEISPSTDPNMLAAAYHFNSSFGAVGGATYLSNKNNQMISIENGVYTYAVPNNTLIKWVKLTLMGVTDNTIITINEEITESGGTTITYAWANTGHAFVPADYEDRIVDLETLTSRHSTKISALEEVVENNATLMFISPDGNDSNSGLTASTPKKTVKACVNAGATRISAKRGIYNEIISLYDIGELEIFPTDNDLTHAVGLEREPIAFDTSDSVAVSSLVDYNAIKRVVYSNSANTQFDKVFTKQSQTPLYGSDYGSRYNATVWLLSEDESTVCIKLKPVLTVAECESEANTFTYVDGYIYINADMTSVAKVIVPTNWDCGIRIDGADRFVLKEVEVRFAGSYNIDIRNCAYFNFYKCACKYTSYGSGFHPYNSNGLMTACYATKNYDGYGISGYGHTTYIDCVSEFNFDDGMSHHNATEGTVIGGRYEGNGKGGITPAYGAKVNIYGGIYKNNSSFGIGYLWASGQGAASGMVQNAVMVGNPVGLSVNANCDVTAMDCIYQDNSSNKDVKGNFTEINSNYTSGGNGGNDVGNSGNDGSESVIGYTNMLPLSVNSDGSDYVGDNGEDGYRKGYRYSSSSAAEKAATGYDCIGYIPVSANDVIRIANVGDINENTDLTMYATAYHFNSSFGAVGGATYLSNANDQMISIENGVYTYAVPNNTAIKWVKLTLMGVTDNTIITVNEEITQINMGGTNESTETLEEALTRIKNWKYPINEDAPVFLLESDKPAIATSEQNTDAVYAKYDTLMNANPGFVSKVNCGMASDGTTPIYVYHFKEAEPHYSGPNWSETKPVILVCSGVHPTEQTGVHSLYYAMEEITTNPKLLDLRRNVHFIVMPMINPTGFTDTTYGVRNPDGIQVHYNFEVDFTYPTDPYYVAHGNRNHGGETPLSIPETQYFDALMDEYKDNLAIVVSCHNNDIDEQYGTGFIWCSCATHFMCNLGFRFADKMSAAWREKHGTAFDEGVRWANEYALAQAAAGSSLFNSTYVKEQPEWDYRVGRASISGSGGTEYKQALKYGVHGVNVETCDRCMILDKDFSKKRTANVTTMGCETYVNFFRTFMAAYDPKDKKDYAPNLPWEN